MSERDEIARILNRSVGGLLDLDMTATDGAYFLQSVADTILAEFLPAHDAKVRAEQREADAQIAERVGQSHTIAASQAVIFDSRWEQGARAASDRIAAAIRAVPANTGTDDSNGGN